VDEALAAFGRAVTETPVQRPPRIAAENKVRDFLNALRGRLSASLTPAEGDSAYTEEVTDILESENRRLRSTIDLLERNAGIQAKLLADTARERDLAVSQVEQMKAQRERDQRALDRFNGITRSIPSIDQSSAKPLSEGEG
jgi:hypothetical protein